MDVRPDQLIDVSLTAAEMIVAGLLGTLLYSLRGRRVSSRDKQLNVSTSVAVSIPQGAPSRVGTSTIEFVSFGTPPKEDAQGTDTVPSPSEARRRNRGDIIRQARVMIERGAATREIAETLRMTDGEIALMRQDNNR